MELLRVTEKLSQTKAELIMKKESLREIINQIKDTGKGTFVTGGAIISGKELFLKYSRINEKIIENIREKIKNLEQAQQKKMHEVIELKKAREGLQKLRERDKEKYIKEVEKTEQKESDERTGMKFARNILKSTS